MAQIIGGTLRQRKFINRIKLAAIAPAIFVLFMYLVVYTALGQEWTMWWSLQGLEKPPFLHESLWEKIIAIGERILFVIVYGLPVFIIQFFRMKKVQEMQDEGRQIRGVKKILDIEKFNEAITKDAIEGAKKFEKNIGAKAESFYTPRIYLGVDNIPYFKDRETKSMIIIGSAGAGKTVAFFDIISKFLAWDELNNKHHCWIVYDRKHDFWRKMYRQGKDFLFLPNDKKTLKWNWFSEFVQYTIKYINKETGHIIKVIKPTSIREAKRLLKIKYDDSIEVVYRKQIVLKELTNLMNGFVTKDEDPTSELWTGKGRDLLKMAFLTVARQNEFPSPKNMIDFFNQFPTRESFVERILELDFARQYGFQIEAVAGGLDKPTEAGQNAFENYSAKAKELNKIVYYYDEDECDFCLADMSVGFNQTYFDKRLFMCQDPENESEYAMVFRAMLELLAKKLIASKSDLERRITLLLDEVASLGYMPEVINNLPEQARSRGNMMILGLQSLARFSQILGDKLMDSALANIQNRVYMSIQDNFTLEWVKRNIGEAEFEVEAESISTETGQSNMSVSVVKREVLSTEELTSPFPTVAWIKMGSYITKTSFASAELPVIAKMEINEDLAETLNVDFDEANDENYKVRREKIENAMLWLLNNTNKKISVKNVAEKAKMSELKTKEIMDQMVEDKEQSLEALGHLINSGFHTNKYSIDFKKQFFEKRTGLPLYRIVSHLPKDIFEEKVEQAKPVEEVVKKPEAAYILEDLGADILEDTKPSGFFGEKKWDV